MLPAAASSAPKHAWTGCSFESWSCHFILLYWCHLWMIRWLVLNFRLPGFEWWTWTIIACAQRNGDRRKGATGNRAEYFWRNWSYTVLSDVWCTSRRLTFWVTWMEHAWGAKTKGHLLFIFLCWGAWQFDERDDSMSTKGAWNGPRRAHDFRRHVACWAKIKRTSYTKLVPTSWEYKVISLKWKWSKSYLSQKRVIIKMSRTAFGKALNLFPIPSLKGKKEKDREEEKDGRNGYWCHMINEPKKERKKKRLTFSSYRTCSFKTDSTKIRIIRGGCHGLESTLSTEIFTKHYFRFIVNNSAI